MIEESDNINKNFSYLTRRTANKTYIKYVLFNATAKYLHVFMATINKLRQVTVKHVLLKRK